MGSNPIRPTIHPRMTRYGVIRKRLRKYWFLKPWDVHTVIRARELDEPGRLSKYNLTGCNCAMCRHERYRKRQDRRRERHEGKQQINAPVVYHEGIIDIGSS